MEKIIILSIVVPVARMAGKLQNLHQWLIQAEEHDVEIILVHDKQDSETSSELHQMLSALRNPKIRLIEKTVNSPGLARNVGMEEARGRWIQFVDSDDLIDLTSVSGAIVEAERQKLDVISGRFRRIFQGLEKQKDSPDWSVKNLENLRTIFTDPGLWRFTFKAERIAGKRFREFLMGEDILFLYELELESSEIYFSPAFHYSYFVGDPNQLSTDPGKSQEAIKTLRYMILSSCKCDRDIRAIIHMRIFLGFIKRRRFQALTETITLCVIAISKDPKILVSYILSIIHIAKYARNSPRESSLGA